MRAAMMANSISSTASIFLCCFVTIIAVYGSVSAVKCYVCDSTLPNCLESVFVPLGISTQDGCTCCTKTVADDLTSRNCASGLASISCVPTSTNFVCATELCNNAGRLHLNSLLGAAILVLVALLLNIR